MEKIILQFLVAVPAVFSLGFGVWILMHNPRSRINTSFFALVFSMFIWAVPHFIMLYPSLSPEALRFWINMNFIGPAVFAPYLVYFSYVFPEDRVKISRFKIFLLSLLPLFVIPLAFAEKFIPQLLHSENFSNYSIFFYLYWLSLFIVIPWALINFRSKIKKLSGKNREAVVFLVSAIFLNMVASAFFSGFLPAVYNYIDLVFLGPGVGGLIFSIFGSYAIVRYDLMEIKVMAKKALFYAVLVTGVTIFMTFVVFLSRTLENSYPNLSLWLIPAIFSVIATFLGIIIWRVIKNSDDLKYDFITTVTHKFRTPISRIIWSIEGIRDQGNLTDMQKTGLRSIEYSIKSILKMVDLMTHLSDERSTDSVLKKEIDFSELLKNILKDQVSEFNRRSISLVVHIKSGVTVMAEENSLRFVLNVLLENALTYTPSGGVVRVGLFLDESKAVFSVKDNGIGMSKAVQKNITTSFYRGGKARRTDTEGMGVSLHITRNIIDEFNGEMDFYSEGEGKGSVFFIKIPFLRVEESEQELKEKKEKTNEKPKE